MPMNSPSINIIGSGSMGHLWSAYLLDKQINVRLFGKKAKNSEQYAVQSPQRCFSCNIAHHSLSNWQAPDLIIICIKAVALENLCIKLQSGVDQKLIDLSSAPIILMMNGMGIIEIAKHYFPKSAVYQASTSHGVRLKNNSLLHTGKGETLIGDSQNNSKLIPNSLTSLIEILQKALPETRWNTNHLEALWTKLLINSIINPLTAIHNIQNGELLTNQKVNQQAKNLTRQLEPLIQKYLPSENWQSIFEKVELVANQTYTNMSSMRQDIMMGRNTEIDFITGYLLKIAAEQQIILPEHEQIVNQIKLLEKENEHSQNSVTL